MILRKGIDKSSGKGRSANDASPTTMGVALQRAGLKSSSMPKPFVSCNDTLSSNTRNSDIEKEKQRLLSLIDKWGDVLLKGYDPDVAANVDELQTRYNQLVATTASINIKR